MTKSYFFSATATDKWCFAFVLFSALFFHFSFPLKHTPSAASFLMSLDFLGGYLTPFV